MRGAGGNGTLQCMIMLPVILIPWQCNPATGAVRVCHSGNNYQRVGDHSPGTLRKRMAFSEDD
jgi:hypothetical protein